MIDVGRSAEAIPYFEAAVSLLKVGSDSWFSSVTNLGASYYYIKKYDKALEVLLKATNGREVKTYRLIVIVYATTGQFDLAKKYLTLGLQKYPGDRVLLRLGSGI